MLSQQELKRLFLYDPETGIMTRRVDRSRLGKAGDIVGWADQKGYLRVGICGRTTNVHRLIWVYVHGHLPKNQIDHVNGIKDDNRLCNLREATPSQNKCNCPTRKDSSTGFKGVWEDKRTGRYRASITVAGQRKSLGFFATKSEAIAARINANQLHGEFARL